MTEEQTTSNEPGQNVEPASKKLSRKGMTWFLVIQCIALIIFFLSLLDIGAYGWTLFCTIPFSIGITVGAFTQKFKTKRFLRGTMITLLVLVVISVFLIAVGIEGAICVLMAVGAIALPAFIGVATGYFIRNAFQTHIIIFVALLNSSFYTYDYFDESLVRSTAEEFVIVNAPRERVWHVLTHGVDFHANTNMFFKAGVNYPTSMKLNYTDEKKCYLMCTLSSGSAALEVEHLDSLRSIRFKVPDEIVPMKELTIYDSLDAPHLQGYFKPSYGEFLIEELDTSKCRLTARTSYSYKITPVFYWQWWTDYLVNAMHRNVLNDLKILAEEN